MKKILSVLLVFLMVLVLSGCDETVSQSKCGDNGVWHQTTLTPSNDGYCIYDTYYTQEEVDSLLIQQNIEIRQDLMEYYIQSYDGKLYNNCRIEDSVKVCDEIEMFIDYGLNIRTAQDLLDLVDNMEDVITSLEQRIEENFYTKDELDEGFEDVRLYLEDLQEQVDELQAQIDELNE